MVKARVSMAASPPSPDGSRPSRSGRPRHLPIRVAGRRGDCSSAPRAPSAPMASSSASTSKSRHNSFRTAASSPAANALMAANSRAMLRDRLHGTGNGTDEGAPGNPMAPEMGGRRRQCAGCRCPAPILPLSPGLGTCRRHAASRALRTFFAFLSACPTASVVPPSSPRSGASATSPAVFARDAARPTKAFCGRSQAR